MADEKNPVVESVEEEDDDDNNPACNLAYYTEEFVNHLVAYQTEPSEEKKADAIRWAYASLLYIEDEGKEIRKNMRTKFKIKDTEVKQWLAVQEKEEAEELAKANVLPTTTTEVVTPTENVTRADNTGSTEKEPEEQ